MSEEKKIKIQSEEEVKPDKGFSFILGIFIAMGIIILFAFLFP